MFTLTPHTYIYIHIWNCGLIISSPTVPTLCACMSVLSKNPLFQAASCSVPGVCSISFLGCHNLGQASSMYPSIVKPTVLDCTVYLQCICVRLKCACSGGERVVLGQVVSMSHFFKPCFNVIRYDVIRYWTPMRSETDKTRCYFPTAVMTAFVKIDSQNSLCLLSH